MGQSAITLESHLCGKGASFDEIFSATTTELTTTTAAYFRASTNSEFAWDDIRLIAGTRSTVETFTHNNANEQLTHTKNGVVTDMEYDAWGRLTKRDDGTHEATYAYRYGGKLYSVTSDFPGEGNVVYETGGDGKRRSRVSGMDETWYNWDAGWTVLSEEDDADGASGDLKRTYRGRNGAHVDGDDPATGAWKFYTHDDLGTSRSIWNDDKSLYASFEQTPYGEVYAASGSTAGVTRRFTGHDWDEATQTLFAPYRHYNPAAARWLSRDPLGSIDGPNEFAYVGGNPVMNRDIFGQSSSSPSQPGEDEVEDNVKNRSAKEAEECERDIERIIKEIQGTLDSMVKTGTVTEEVRKGVFRTRTNRVVAGIEFQITSRTKISVSTGYIPALPGNTTHGISIRKNRIRISKANCDLRTKGKTEWREFSWLVAHEVAHATHKFSRLRYMMDVFSDYKDNQEDIADAFANLLYGPSKPPRYRG